MKRTAIRSLACCLAIALLLSLTACVKQVEPQSIGVPYEALTASARIPWDMTVFEGDLYVGAGDFDDNISPEHAMRYSLDEESWETCGAIPDEQINRFLVLNGQLTIPGTDPIGGWESGSYYRLTDGEFETISGIMNGIHVFDLALYDGMLFAALGVDEWHMPLALSRDNGVSFETVPTVMDGLPVLAEGLNRVYDFFVFEDALYCLYNDNLFIYNEDAASPQFHFVTSWSKKYDLVKETYVPIIAKAAFGDGYFFTTERLYFCRYTEEGLSLPEEIALQHADAVTDLFVYDGLLYLLSYDRTLSGYTVYVQTSEDGKAFDTLFRFKHPLPAMSFAFDGETFYFGMGKIGSSSAQNGEILTVQTD